MPLIRAGVGLSSGADTAVAAAEASRRAIAGLEEGRADWCIVFATYGHGTDLDALLTGVSVECGTPYVVGCSGRGVIAEGREIEDGPAVGVLAIRSEVLRGTPFLFREEETRGLAAGMRAGQRLMGSRGTRDLVLVWPDPFRVRPDRFLQGLASTLGGIPVAGGAAAAGASGGATFQVCGAESASGAVSGIRLAGEFRHRIVVTQGCRSTGEPVRVTRAHDNLILELDGRPAYEVMCERVPPRFLRAPEDTVACVSIGLIPPAGLPPPGRRELLIRNLVAVDPDTGILAIGDPVEGGQSLVFAVRDPEAAREDLETLVSEIAVADGNGYRFGLYFDCLARGRSLYGTNGVDAQILSRAFPDLPILGFFGNAEIAPLRGVNRLFTYSGVLVLVGE